MTDAGVSAFRGANATTGALSAFIDAVKTKQVKHGSVLIIENLDRLTRQQTSAALDLFLSILRHGVTIVTLSDGQPETFNYDNLDERKLILAIFDMSRAHRESARKSELSKANWEERRKATAEGKTIGELCPSWLRSKADRSGHTIITKHAAIIKRIFSLYLDGHGTEAIAMKLNNEGVPTLGCSTHWQNATVRHFLKAETLIGRRQHYRVEIINGIKKRVPCGDPIDNYYPAVIDQDTWEQVQYQRRIRKRSAGK